jgi:hypothetical protein
MFVAQEEAKTQLPGFLFSLGAGVKWAVFGPHLFG